jgi:hypothetical protein
VGRILQNKGPRFMGKMGGFIDPQNAYLITKSLRQMRLFKSPQSGNRELSLHHDPDR